VVVLTLLLGLVTAVALAVWTKAAELTFAGLNEPVQMVMSVLTPLIGILLVHDRQRPGAAIVTAILTNAVIAVAGLAFGAVAVAIRAEGGGAWGRAGLIVVGSVLVQIVATLVGTGFGLLMRSRLIAFLSTIVFPIGVLWALGAFDAGRSAQPWLTPLAIARHLLSGDMAAVNWVQWLVMALIWGAGLNLLGAVRAKHRPDNEDG
jgi:hypothetical protein